MERWEIIERRVLVAVGTALIAFSAWLLVYGERALFAVLLAPIIFWVFWQAFFEGKLGSGKPASGTERLMYLTFLWARRLVIGGISLAGATVAFTLALDGADFMAIFLPVGLSLFAGWVAIFGAGRAMSMSDDLHVHRERKQRYRKP